MRVVGGINGPVIYDISEIGTSGLSPHTLYLYNLEAMDTDFFDRFLERIATMWPKVTME